MKEITCQQADMESTRVIVAGTGVWGPGGYEIVDILKYIKRPAGGSYFYCDMMHTLTGKVYEMQMYSTAGMLVTVATD